MNFMIGRLYAQIRCGSPLRYVNPVFEKKINGPARRGFLLPGTDS
jgi:hypothetical protein